MYPAKACCAVSATQGLLPAPASSPAANGCLEGAQPKIPAANRRLQGANPSRQPAPAPNNPQIPPHNLQITPSDLRRPKTTRKSVPTRCAESDRVRSPKQPAQSQTRCAGPGDAPPEWPGYYCLAPQPANNCRYPLLSLAAPYRMCSSMRRFWRRCTSVSLGASGWVSP
jgi:hypothetical protein